MVRIILKGILMKGLSISVSEEMGCIKKQYLLYKIAHECFRQISTANKIRTWVFSMLKTD
jgi:hypothetical protein